MREGFSLRIRAVTAAVLSLLCGAGTSLAQVVNGNQLPNPRLTIVTPCGGKVGTTFEVSFTGTDLEDPEGLLFSHAGMKAVPVIPPPPPPMKVDPKKPAPPMKKAKVVVTRFTVTIGPEVPPGRHEVRLVNHWGISNPRVFVVGTANEVTEKEPNNDVEQAQRVALGSTINGIISAPTDVDYFVFAAKKGQCVVVSCLGATLDSRLNPELKLYDSLGRELGGHRPPPGKDAVVACMIPADGDYYVRLCQFTYTQGSPEHFYRLNISTTPWITAVFPPTLEPGKTTPVMLYGYSLPGSQPVPGPMTAGRNLEQLSVNVTAPSEPALLQGQVSPESAYVDGFEYRLRPPQGESNPVLLTLAHAPQVLDNGGNISAAAAQVVPLPCAIAGRIAAPRQRHWYAFQAKKGEVYTIEVLSHRLGAPTDMYYVLRNATNPKQISEITQQDDDPRDLGQNQLYTPSRDPAPFRFAVPADGRYELVVGSHLSDTQFGPEHVYAIRITPEQPDFRLLIMPPDPHRPDTCQLAAGGNAYLTVFVYRQDGFKGDVALSVDGLPAGITCKPQVASAGLKHSFLVLSAAASAPAFTGEIKVKGTAVLGGKSVVRQARPFGIVWPVQPQQNIPVIARLEQRLMLAVREKAPLSLTASVDKVTVSHGDKLTIPLKLTRLWADFKGSFQVAGDPQDLPQGMNFGGLNFTPGKDEQQVVMTVPTNVQPGIYGLAFRGSAAIPFNKDREAKQKPNVNVVQPSTPVLVTILPKQVARLSVNNSNLNVKPASVTDLVVRVSRQFDYAGPFQVKLLLPPGTQGIHVDAVTLPPGQDEVKLPVRVSASASLGNRPNLTLEAIAQWDGTVPLRHETKVNLNVVK
jgi:hypothetical protein